MRRLTQLERAMLRYQGMPASDAARGAGTTVERVLQLRRDLRARGVLPPLPSTELEPAAGQLQLDMDAAELMRGNKPPAGL